MRIHTTHGSTHTHTCRCTTQRYVGSLSPALLPVAVGIPFIPLRYAFYPPTDHEAALNALDLQLQALCSDYVDLTNTENSRNLSRSRSMCMHAA